MKLAYNTHKSRIVEILSKAFADNKSTNYVIKNDNKRLDRIKGLVDYSYNICSAFGETWISDDHNACALILLPEKKKTTFKSVLWDAKLATGCIGLNRVGKVLKREALVHQNHPKEPYYYLWYIGVDPNQQNQGIGSAFMQEVLDRCDQKARPIYLETSTLRNLPWYKKYDFEIFNELDFTFPLYQLRRN
ncbi:GNAT family N-acetyltransferase [Catalinimonas sp. 4WD22]|uniref:GNAT family N-acetyltransferase n=1 Tax=Catalinimonas locisalis TaxID=3133978 RepID=UPI003100EF42